MSWINLLFSQLLCFVTRCQNSHCLRGGNVLMKVTVASCVKDVSSGTQIDFHNHMLLCCHFSKVMMFCENTSFFFFFSHCFLLYDKRELDTKTEWVTTPSPPLPFRFPSCFLIGGCSDFLIRSLLGSLDSRIRLRSKCWGDVLSFIQQICIPDTVPEN